MNILSLFDGMSCAQIALNRIGIKPDNYYSSEIDKYTIKVTQFNFPATIQLGDITKVKGSSLPPIDLLIGGSPCQGFSFAGAQLNFNDPRSALFFEYVRILNEVKPQYFLLENVRMKQEHQNIISEQLGVYPIEINSALVSAQNRRRLYWTNIPNISQPEDKGFLLKDIVEDGGVLKEKSQTILSTIYKENAKSMLVRNKQGLLVVCGVEKEKNNAYVNRCIQVGKADIKGHDSVKRVYSPEGKSPTLTTMGGGHREPKVAIEELTWRKLTPLECERLQTVPDNYTLADGSISNTQRYKMLGNGFTVDVIAHILRNIE